LWELHWALSSAAQSVVQWVDWSAVQKVALLVVQWAGQWADPRVDQKVALLVAQ
jgi:hypothetical protein